mmetsp:Transcript_52948/g.139518  ORF Transcript_52948/g.139518 Transcript_52948/m.139518 type:complete len:108 (+) Transcript_52948:2159-2482(+)
MLRTGNGTIICLDSSGCTSVSLTGVKVECRDTSSGPLNSTSRAAVLQLVGSKGNVTGGGFFGCTSADDGGAIWANGDATVGLNGERLHQCLTDWCEGGMQGHKLWSP